MQLSNSTAAIESGVVPAADLGAANPLSQMGRSSVAVLSFLWIAFQSFLFIFPQSSLIQCPVHLGFALALTVLCRPLRATRASRSLSGVVDLCLLFIIAAIWIYYLACADRLANRIEAVDEILAIDVVMGLALVGIVLECLRRVAGWPLVLLIVGFLAFGFVAKLFPGWLELAWLPEMFKFSGFTVAEAIESLTMSANGLLGVTTSTSVLFVFYFIVFGAVYAAIGGGQLFTDIALRAAGRQVGGAAKASVISSALMGTVSGSAVANVAADGIFTIPLMKATGYRPAHAAAVEAVASTGGQLMPPVMGVAAFVMAELLQRPYSEIALAAFVPALGFYWSLFLLIDLNARKSRVGALVGEKISINPMSPRLYLLIPPAILVVMLTMGKSASYSAAIATITCIPINWLGGRRLRGREWTGVMQQACRQAAEVAVPIAAIGIIIEVAVQSNLALKFALFLVETGAGNVLASLTLIVIGCIIMGMGLPTVAAYMIGAIFFVPVILEFGVDPIGAHLFVMYYSVLSMITPPVALASITAAGLAKADSTATGLKAFQISLVAFFIPFVFLFEPALLFRGTVLGFMLGLITLGSGVFGWAVAMEGYLGRCLSLWQRLAVGLVSIIILLAPVLGDAVRVRFGLMATEARLWALFVPVLLLMILLLPVLLGQKKTACS